LSDQIPQLVVPAGSWQGARIVPKIEERSEEQISWALLGCTLAPGWTERNFALGDRAALSLLFPGASQIISTLTRT